MRHFFNLLFMICLSISTTYAFTHLKCPSISEIKAVRWLEAHQHPFDPDVWNFASTTIKIDSAIWNLWFGTFFPHVSTAVLALKAAEEYFSKANIIIKHPHPYADRQGHFICDYMPTGREFWLSAISPPVLGTMPV